MNNIGAVVNHNIIAAEAMYKRNPQAYDYMLCALNEYFAYIYELIEEKNLGEIWEILESFGYDIYNVKYIDLRYIVTIGEGYDIEKGEADIYDITIDPYMKEVRESNILDYDYD